MKTERELFLRYWIDNNLPYDGDDDDIEVAWTAWKASSQREGYKLVPIEPTEAMLDAQDYIRDESAIEIYKTMIGAVP